jgi:signal transduction histidine kinase
MVGRAIVFIFLLVVLFPLLGVVGAMALGYVDGPRRWLVLGIAVLVLVGLWLFARRMFGRSWGPIGELIDATQRLGAGETGVRIANRGPGPFGAVTASFNRMAARLEEEDERRRRLLADLGHELRTPLTVIRGEIEAVLDGLHDPGSLSHVIDEVDLMERLLEDLRVLALTEAGRLQLHTEPTNLEGLVGDVLDSFATTLSELGIVPSVKATSSLEELELDPHRMHQVLANLIANAIHQMPEGGLLEVTLSAGRQQLTIDVSDNGPGIPETQIDRIFERFVRSGDSAGTGLGLSIARDLVEAHGGTLTAHNRPTGGAVFTITLPIGDSRAHEPASPTLPRA